MFCELNTHIHTLTHTHAKGGDFFLYHHFRQSKALESVLVELNKCYLKFGGQKDPKYKSEMSIYIGTGDWVNSYYTSISRNTV